MQTVVNKKYLLLFLLVWTYNFMYAQTDTIDIKSDSGLNWFVSAGIGCQISGYKKEDFIGSNVSPLLNVTAGRWFTKAIALQTGYKGTYFHTISDDRKHHYIFLYVEALLNLNNLRKVQNSSSSLWSLNLHAGPGYFYNYDYDRPNFCANIGMSNGFRLTNRVQANLDISAIVGWDIYQGDEDILPGVALGVSYTF